LAEHVDVAPEALQHTRFIDRAGPAEAKEIVHNLDATFDGRGGAHAQLDTFTLRQVCEIRAFGRVRVNASVQRARRICYCANSCDRAAESNLLCRLGRRRLEVGRADFGRQQLDADRLPHRAGTEEGAGVGAAPRWTAWRSIRVHCDTSMLNR